jgi:hypothetical protein
MNTCKFVPVLTVNLKLMCRSLNESRRGRCRRPDSYLGGYLPHFKIVYVLSGPVLEPGISQVRNSNAAATFVNFLVKAFTARHLLSPLNEVHKKNVQWGGQVYPPDCEFTRPKIFDKRLLINLGNARPFTKFPGKLWFSSEEIQYVLP